MFTLRSLISAFAGAMDGFRADWTVWRICRQSPCALTRFMCMHLFSQSRNKVRLLILWRIDGKRGGKTPDFRLSSFHLDPLLLLLLVVDEISSGSESRFLNNRRREEIRQGWKSDLEEVGECLAPAR